MKTHFSKSSLSSISVRRSKTSAGFQTCRTTNFPAFALRFGAVASKRSRDGQFGKSRDVVKRRAANRPSSFNSIISRSQLTASDLVNLVLERALVLGCPASTLAAV